MYGEVFCKVYNELGWNYYPEAFGESLLRWMDRTGAKISSSLDLACGTGILCRVLHDRGIEAAGADLSPAMIAVARENHPGISFRVADMVTDRPDRKVDLVTCTGDSLNHIRQLRDVEQVFQNVYDCLNPGGFFVFDLLNEQEVSNDEPFEFDFSQDLRVWFQMTRPGAGEVNLCIRVYEQGLLQAEENIRERIHSPEEVCGLLTGRGFRVLRCANRLMDEDPAGTTWYIIAAKP